MNLGQCKVEGKSYAFNDEFILNNCEEKCTCREDKSITCVPLCPLSLVRCSAGYKVEYYKEPNVGNSCSCSRSRCVEGKERNNIVP